MTIEAFDVQDKALGTGDVSTYSFDFRIFAPTDLLIYIQDAGGNLINKIRGDDTTILQFLQFDPVNGGGQIFLNSVLADSWVITFILAPDVPVQVTPFKSKSSFNFPSLEAALDYLTLLVQRIHWMAFRSVKLHDLDDVTAFDMTLPINLANYPGGIPSINSAGTGFEIASTVGQIKALSSGGLYARAGMSRGLPLTILAATGIVPAGVAREVMFVQGPSVGTIAVTKNPQIAAGTIIGQELVIIGGSGTQILTLATGNGLDLASLMTLGAGNALGLVWDGANWSEAFRR